MTNHTAEGRKVSTVESPEAPPAVGGYAQAVHLRDVTELLFISGQVPEDPAGLVPASFVEQCRLAWANVATQLAAARLSVHDLVKVTTFLSAREYAAESQRVRVEVLGGHRPALTVVITDIFDERWLLEIEAIAAR